MTIAVPRLATNRATTITGRPGNATAVEMSTIGLIAGEESRNANAAAGVTPRRINAPATGTEPHSHAGRIAPATPATGTAAPVRGSARSKNLVGTNAVIAADSTVPKTQKRHRLHHHRHEHRHQRQRPGRRDQLHQPRPRQHGQNHHGRHDQ